MTINQRIEELRSERNWSREALAAKLGVSITTANRICTDGEPVSKGVLRAFENLGINPEWIQTGNQGVSKFLSMDQLAIKRAVDPNPPNSTDSFTDWKDELIAELRADKQRLWDFIQKSLPTPGKLKGVLGARIWAYLCTNSGTLRVNAA